MWWGFSFGRNDNTNVCDGERGMRMTLGRAAVRDVDPLRGRAAEVGRAARRCGLDDVTSWLQLLPPLIEDTEK